MNTILICPSERLETTLLAEAAPLSNALLLGQPLIECWLSHLACTGIKNVLILAADRPEQTRHVTGSGARWGLSVEVVSEALEPTPAQAFAKYGRASGLSSPEEVLIADRLPGLLNRPLFGSYADFFHSALAWMPHANMPDRVGVHEIQPGIWASIPNRISPRARLSPPCWIGRNVFIGEEAVVGPGAILENGAFVEPAAEVEHSWIGPETLLGRFVQVHSSLALGSTLVNWRTGSTIQVADAFLLCALRQTRKAGAEKSLEAPATRLAQTKEEIQWLWKHLLTNKGG